MNTYQKALVEEHSHLITRTQQLHDYVYSNEANLDDRFEFANKCIQLASMKKYEEALRARLENSGVLFEDGEYFERVASINTGGSDFDTDSDTCCEKCHEPHE